ncbi:MAG: SUMF1/EgtB/PvdO family nonheme iron enzyme [Rhodospirillales bacterium]
MRMTCAVLICLLLGLSAGSAQASKRVALVIGNDSYATLPALRNAGKDARDVAAKLEGLGFEVILRLNAGERAMGRALTEFESRLSGGDAGLVYYAGHGVQVDGRNWLIPSDARVEDETDLPYEAIDASDFLSGMERAGAPVNIVILDACRDNPLPKRKRSGARGLAVEAGPSVQGIVMLYSAGPGEAAEDGPPGGNGLFTGELLKVIDRPGLTLEQVFKQTVREVNRATRGRQTPWLNTSLAGDFYFAPAAPSAPAASAPAPTAGLDKEVVFWQSIQSSRDASLYEAYLAQFPDGTFAPLARAKIASLKGEAVASLTPPTAAAEPATPQSPSPSYIVTDSRETKWVSARGTVNVRSGPGTDVPVVGRLGSGDEVEVTGQVDGADWVRVALADGGTGFVYAPLLGDAKPEPDRVRSLSAGAVFRDCENALVATSGASVPGGVFCGPELVVIPPGSFMMGSTEYASEQPVHKVDIGYRFAVGRYEVTQSEWRSVMGWDPSRFKGADRPVENVTWADAQAFIGKLNARTGRKYRLLTESEWEYVARAGTTTKYPWGNDIGRGNANCDVCGSRWDNRATAPVGSFAANGFGLHDLHGNVYEWVEDCYKDSYSGAPTNGRANTTGDCRMRVVRGGSWNIYPVYLRSAFRFRLDSVIRSGNYGFRIARTL